MLFDGRRVVDHGQLKNEELLQQLRQRLFGTQPYTTVIEQIESMGMAVGAEVFETVFWSGRFAQTAPCSRARPCWGLSLLQPHLQTARRAHGDEASGGEVTRWIFHSR